MFGSGEESMSKPIIDTTKKYVLCGDVYSRTGVETWTSPTAPKRLFGELQMQYFLDGGILTEYVPPEPVKMTMTVRADRLRLDLDPPIKGADAVTFLVSISPYVFGSEVFEALDGMTFDVVQRMPENV